ncbi:MAG: hypothetical protein NTY76_05705 [Candidatus Omnitrophica bacterium]|nr:hypothetical protein [Candidatus Omnitrophota bacterium]
MADLSQLQVITYGTYDTFGNSTSQVIDSYSSATPDPTKLIDHKIITNDYTVRDANGVIDQAATDIARRHGNAYMSTVDRYTSLEATPESLIEETITKTNLFDNRGNAVKQTSETFVKDPSTGILQLQKETTVENINIDNRGDAGLQHITIKQPDPANAGELTIVTYQEITNRHFDASHNVDNQMVYTYTESGGVLLDVQEIRSEGFTSSGTAQKQTIATYSDAAKTSITDAKVVENDVKSITPQGYVGKTKITRYSAATIADTGTGAISLIPADDNKELV